MGSVIALTENCPTVPGTPSTMEELMPELRELYVNLRVNNVLSGWSAITQWTGDTTKAPFKNAAMYLLILDPAKFTIEIRPYLQDQLASANAQYAKLEKDRPDLQAVLVSVDSLAALRTAYPNYFLDTSAFLATVEKALAFGNE
jgi:hypothetical protein